MNPINLDNYLWIVVFGGVFSFISSFGIGSNDVANAFATSIGSGALTLKSAIVIASVCEFSGAFFMGSHVTTTIRKGITNYECYEENPDILMYGCMCVLASMAIWLIAASKFSLPVSTTHSVIGGLIGMTMSTVGSECVKWNESISDFPYISGVSAIVLSWILSPVLSGVCAVILYVALRNLCLRSEYAFDRIWFFYPALIVLTVTINTFFLLWKGFKNMETEIEVLTTGEVFGISLGVGVIMSVIAIPFLKKIKKHVEITETNHMFEISSETKKIHDNAEYFDNKAEEGLKYLQVLTSICDSFAHGANDVANSVGPFAAIYLTYKNEGVEKKSEMGDDAYWILSLGGVGMIAGLVCYGRNIIETIGVKLSKITPSRGLCIELGSAIVIITGARYGWPLSTTHCQIGATAAIAMLEGRYGIDWNIFVKTCIGWVLTLVIVGGRSAILTAQGVYAPSIN